MASNLESLDTNIIIRVIENDIPKLKKRSEKLLEKSDTNFLLSDAVINEVVFVLSKKYDRSREYIVKSLVVFLKNEKIICDRDFYSKVFELFIKHPSLSFTDCYLSVEAAKNQAEPLWTFDHKFAVQSPVAKEVK